VQAALLALATSVSFLPRDSSGRPVLAGVVALTHTHTWASPDSTASRTQHKSSWQKPSWRWLSTWAAA